MSLRDKDQEEKSTEPTAEPTAKETTTEVATRASQELAPVTSSAFISNPILLDAVVGASYGDFISVTASNGTHMTSDKTDLGKVLKFQALVVNDVTKIVPGSTDEEAKEFFKVSNDGEFTNDGIPVNEALQDALDAGYSKASIKHYIDIICMLIECDDKDFIGETVTLQLAPSSCRKWRPLASRCKMKAAVGKLKTEPVAGNEAEFGSAVVFTSTATPTSWSGNDYTVFEFSI